MPAPKPKPTLADYVTVAISPMLIMTLVGSLVYFLVEILYSGQFVGRVLYILFFFVFAIVLIARLSMASESASRAPLYGAVLSLLVWIGLGQFVEYPPELLSVSWIINAMLVGVVWWSSHRLTWDCTHVDDSDRATATGLLRAAGLEGDGEPEPADTPAEEEDAKPVGLWERIQQYREARKKRHTPGVWVVYFSLAALPIFGLGQALIPAEETARRRYVFWLMALYVASALGLLVTTAFLGLRRYLRQRGVPMPPAITSAWLALGGGLALALLVAGALLPRPNPEYSVIPFGRAGSKDRDASRLALKGGDSGRSERPGREPQNDPRGQPGQSGKQPDPQGARQDQQGNPDQKQDGQGKGQNGQGKDGQGKGKDGEKPSGDGSNRQDGQGGKDQSDKGDGRSSDKGDQRTDQGRGSRDPDKKGADRPTGKGRPSDDAGRDRSGTSPPQTPPPPARSLPGLEKIAGLLRWLVLIALAVAAVVFVLRGGLRFLAHFFDWPRWILAALRAFWAGLFGRRNEEGEPADEPEEEAPPPRPFGEYTNPFRDGRADRAAVAELARYSFEALEAWAYDRGIARMADETPLEFSGRVGAVFPALGADAQRLGALYAQVLYAPGEPPAGARTGLRQFWDRLERVQEQPLSA